MSMQIDKKSDSRWKSIDSKVGTLDLDKQTNYVTVLLKGGFTYRQIEKIASVHRKMTKNRLYSARKVRN